MTPAKAIAATHTRTRAAKAREPRKPARVRQPRVRYAKAADGQWYYTLTGANGEAMLRSTDGYTRQVDARRGWRDAVAAIWKLET